MFQITKFIQKAFFKYIHACRPTNEMERNGENIDMKTQLQVLRTYALTSQL